MSTTKYPLLFSPGNIGSMRLRNRLVMPAIGSNLAGADGHVNDRMIDYYAERARGGVGLVVVELAVVEMRGKHVAGELFVAGNDCLPGLKRLVDGIHSGGAKAAIQIAHGGREAKSKLCLTQPVAPSAVQSWATHSEMPRALTIAEVEEMVQTFVNAAVLSRNAGFDAVEVHGAHYYLISQFLSGSSNIRTDKYGGSLENRARFLLEILDGCRKALGEDYPLMVRLNGAEFGMENGTTIEETVATARMAAEHGAEAIHMTAVGKGPWLHLPFTKKPAEIMPLVAAVKKGVDIPVIAVGTLDLELGEKVLRDGQADFISIARGVLADPELPRKGAEGRENEIRPCIMCLECLNAIMYQGAAIHCSVNPACANESQYEIKPASRKKKVLVIGGGPAGLEAASVAAARGHAVTLWEKSGILGGQLSVAAAPPGKDRLLKLSRFLAEQARRSGVTVELNREPTLDAVRTLRPDTVVLAAGARPTIPEIPGIDGKNVVLAERVLSGEVKAGQRVVVLGGDLVGCETAEFLMEQGKKVTVTRRGNRMAANMVPIVRRMLLDRLEAGGVTLLTEVQYRRIGEEGLTILDKDGKERLLEAETIVLAAGYTPNDLKARIDGVAPEVHSIGDCVQPRSIMLAIEEGRRVGCSI